MFVALYGPPCKFYETTGFAHYKFDFVAFSQVLHIFLLNVCIKESIFTTPSHVTKTPGFVLTIFFNFTTHQPYKFIIYLTNIIFFFTNVQFF